MTYGDTAADQANLLKLIALNEITKLNRIYARAQDRLDPTAQRSVFWDDAWIELGSFSGDADAFVAFAQGQLANMAATHHLLGQVDVEFIGDEAFGEVYTIAYHRFHRGNKQEDLIIGGRYVDRYERRSNVWKIAFRSEIVDWARAGEPYESFFEGRRPEFRSSRASIDLSCRRQVLRRPDQRQPG